MLGLRVKLLVTAGSVALVLVITLLLSEFPLYARISTVAIADSFDFPLGNPDGAGFGPYPTTDYDVQNPDLSGFKECFGADWSQLWHAGEDWFKDGNPSGTAGAVVTAVANGKVRFADPNYSYNPGRVVIIQHDLPDGGIVYSMYGHLQDVYVAADQEVTKGKPIGTVYNQGNNSHLHWEIRYFLDGSVICANSGIPGPGYTYPKHPDEWGYTDPTNFINRHRLPAPTPAAPSNVQARNVTLPTGRTGTQVSWTDNADNELGFRVVDQNRPQEYDAPAASGTGATVSLTLPFASGCFRVYAYNAFGNSPLSEMACTPTTVERKAPYDFITELQGLVNCNGSNAAGTGEARVERPQER